MVEDALCSLSFTPKILKVSRDACLFKINGERTKISFAPVSRYSTIKICISRQRDISQNNTILY